MSRRFAHCVMHNKDSWRIRAEDLIRHFQVAGVNPIARMDNGDLSRMNGGLPAQTMGQIFIHLTYKGFYVTEVFEDRRAQTESAWLKCRD